MDSDYKTYLAANILNEDRIVTYRLLSRALKIHVNLAKEMLFEFYQQQNRKKPGTVHALYLIAGRIHPTRQLKTNSRNGSDGEVSHMRSSPPFAVSPQAHLLYPNEYTPALSITLVKEEDLEQVRKYYESINSVHVYSLGPSSINGLEILSDANREISENYAVQDPIEIASTYGIIVNKTVRRRTVRHLAPPATLALPPASAITKPSESETIAPYSSVPKSNPVFASISTTKAGKNPSNKSIPKGGAPATKNIPTPSNPAPASRESSGGIFASFLKEKPAAKREDVNVSINASTTSTVEDSTMKDASDEEEEETYILPPRGVKKNVDGDRKSRNERERALAEMMDEDDDDEPALSTFPQDAREVEDLETTTHNLLPTASKAAEEYTEVSDGRRRGRRRVTKKKTIKDDEGYLVTKEEPSWESFSEDEPVVKAKSLIPSASTGPKVKRPTGKPGQGNIMSFFAKKT